MLLCTYLGQNATKLQAIDMEIWIILVEYHPSGIPRNPVGIPGHYGALTKYSRGILGVSWNIIPTHSNSILVASLRAKYALQPWPPYSTCA